MTASPIAACVVAKRTRAVSGPDAVGGLVRASTARLASTDNAATPPSEGLVVAVVVPLVVPLSASLPPPSGIGQLCVDSVIVGVFGDAVVISIETVASPRTPRAARVKCTG